MRQEVLEIGTTPRFENRFLTRPDESSSVQIDSAQVIATLFVSMKLIWNHHLSKILNIKCIMKLNYMVQSYYIRQGTTRA